MREIKKTFKNLSWQADWRVKALKQAGRHKEIIPLLELEAAATGSYDRLVEHLIEAKKIKEAEKWIHKGIETTKKDSPGTAAQLKKALQSIREYQKNQRQ